MQREGTSRRQHSRPAGTKNAYLQMNKTLLSLSGRHVERTSFSLHSSLIFSLSLPLSTENVTFSSGPLLVQPMLAKPVGKECTAEEGSIHTASGPYLPRGKQSFSWLHLDVCMDFQLNRGKYHLGSREAMLCMLSLAEGLNVTNPNSEAKLQQHPLSARDSV